MTGQTPNIMLVYRAWADAHITELNAGHPSMIADPETVSQVIQQAAKAIS